MCSNGVSSSGQLALVIFASDSAEVFINGATADMFIALVTK